MSMGKGTQKQELCVAMEANNIALDEFLEKKEIPRSRYFEEKGF